MLKPLSEDKLRNIWQHVIHKVLFSSGKFCVFAKGRPNNNEKNIDQQYFEKAFSNTSKPDEDSIASLMQLQLENEAKNGVPEDMEILSWIQDIVWEQPEGSGNSQLNLGDQMNCSMETDCRDKDVQSKFLETTSHDLVCEGPLPEGQPQLSDKVTVKEDKNLEAGLKRQRVTSIIPLQNKSGVKSSPLAAEHSIQGSDVNHSAGTKAKKTKVLSNTKILRRVRQLI